MIARANRFTGFPRPATLEDYASAAEELDGELATLPATIAVYRYGSVSAPGISDLDRLVVVDEARAVPAIWLRLSDRTRELAMHTPALVDAETFTKHRWLAELGRLECVFGDALPVEPRPVPEYSEPLIAAEALVTLALKLAKLAVTGRIKVRALLCELRNLGLDLTLAGVPPQEAPDAWRLVDEITHLRAGWWDVPADERRRRLRDLVDRTPASVDQAISALAGRLGAVPPRELRLGKPWQNVTLVAGDIHRNGSGTRLAQLLGRSRRLGEARWRSTSRRLVLPCAVVALLAGDAAHEYASFRAERDKLAVRHAGTLRAASGYSALTLALPFVT